MIRSECVFVGSRRTQQSEGGSDSVEGIGRGEWRKSSLSDEIAVDDVEGQRGSFGRAGTVEVDDTEETLDNKEKGVTP